MWITQLSWVIIHSCKWFALEKEDGDIFEEKRSFERFLKINKCNKDCLSHENFGNILLCNFIYFIKYYLLNILWDKFKIAWIVFWKFCNLLIINYERKLF